MLKLMSRFPKPWTLLLIVALGVCLVAPAQADVRKGNGEVGFDFGMTSFEEEISDSAAGRFSLRAGIMASRLLEFEGQLSVADRSNLNLSSGMVNVVFNFRTGDRLMAYFLLGGGAARLDLDFDDSIGAAGQFAGGFRAFGGEGRIGLRLEIGAMVADHFDDARIYPSATVGFTFVLGGHHNHRAPRHSGMTYQ
jgi:opacity protein-like surface antigen